MDKKKIGRFLKLLREEKGLSQERALNAIYEENGKALDFCPSAAVVSKWERGESLPNIDNIEDLSHFYNVSIDEILNGERAFTVNYKEKYFICNKDWEKAFSNEIKYLAEDRFVVEKRILELEKQQHLLIELKFNELLEKLVKETITTSEEKEFDFICERFYVLEDNAAIDDIKFKIRKLCVAMHDSTFEDKLWESYKFFDYKYKVDYIYNLSEIALDGIDNIIGEIIKNSPDYVKDVLLAFVQRNNVAFRYDSNINDDKLLKHFGKNYDEELLTKRAIKLLIESGASLNNKILGYYKNYRRTEDVFNALWRAYSQYKSPFLIRTINSEKEMFYLIENTEKNRKLMNKIIECVFKESDIDFLERKLYNGETEYEYEGSIWCGIDDINNPEYENCKDNVLQEDMEAIMREIRDMSYNEYYKNRDIVATQKLLKELDKLSLSEIRSKYFPMETRNDE